MGKMANIHGVLVKEHHGHKIYQDADKFYVTDKDDNIVGTSNCLEGALIVASLGKQGCNDLFPKKRGRRK